LNLQPVSFTKSRKGDITKALIARDDLGAVVTGRDTLFLSFEVPPKKDGMTREFIFHTVGHYISSGGSPPDDKGDELAKIDKYTFDNFPNPFNPSTTFKFALPQGTEVKLEIYNILGRRVRTVADGYYETGTHRVVWDGKNESGREVASGIYFARFKTADFETSKKMVVVK